MKKWLQSILRNDLVTAFYKCVTCGHKTTKEAALPATLPAFHEEYCPKCRADRKFIQVK